MPLKKLSRFSPLLWICAFYLFASLGLRIVLWACFGSSEEVALWQLPGLLGTGLLNDAIELLYLMLPLTLYLYLLPNRLASTRWHERVFSALCYLTLFGMTFLAAAEFFFFEEFDARFNLVAVDYLIYPTEVLTNIWDTYPVSVVLAVSAALAALVFKWVHPFLIKPLEVPSDFKTRSLFTAGHILLLTLAVITFSTDTLALSENRVANEIGSNGLSSLFRAFRTNHLSYDLYYATLSQKRSFELVRNELGFANTDVPAPQLTNLARTVAPNPSGLGHMNVVVIVEESFGARFVGAYGDTRGLTPNFDRLAEQGLLFRNAFATGTRTARGLEAIAASFPPIPSESIIKRPGCEKIANWGKTMKESGYSASFLYGGYGYFDNMNTFFSSNGFDISDRSDISDPSFSNIWGVSDEDLFGHAIRYYDGLQKREKPFFSIIMTTSNHTPYTFPEGIAGVPPEGGGRKAGIRYADFALGKFFDEASSHPWYNNTLFVVVADHDARVYGRALIPVKNYRIPLLFFAPGQIEPGTVETATSQIDIAPTVLGLLGLPYQAPFYGQNVLCADARTPRPILINHNHDVALLYGDRLAVLGLNESTRTFQFDPASGHLTPIPEDRKLIDMATAYYQSASWLFTNRKYL